MKKSLFLIIIISIILILTKYYVSNYKIEYTVNNYNIKEIYKDKRFYFEIKKDITYNFDIYDKRTLSKTKIESIEEIDLDTYYCIVPKIKDIDTYPLCYDKTNKEYIDYNLIDNELLTPYQTASNMDSKPDKDYVYYNTLDDKTYMALWTYKGYIVMNKDTYNKVDIFNKDKYDNTISYMIDNTIYMPNYDEEHEYSSLVAFNIETQKINKIKLNKNIDYDSYIVGNIKNKLYIFDNKSNILYELDLKSNKSEIKSNNETGFVKYEDGEWVNCSRTEYKIDKIKYGNKPSSNYEYTINNGLYKIIKENKNIKTKVSNDITNIIFEHDNDIYYIYEDSLYLYNPLKGNNKVFYNYELNFNKDNTIFTYIK